MRKQLDSLTALRGLAALLVLLFHAGIGNRGYLGVDLFFFLSGFVLTHAYGQKFAVVTFLGYRTFLRARLARIYPLHLLTLACLLPLYNRAPQFSGLALVHNLLLTQAPWYGESWNFPAWSISAEWHAYLIFPVLVGLIVKKSATAKLAIAAGCILTVSILYLAASLLSATPQGALAFTPAVLVRAFPEFIVGMVLYHLYTEGWANRIFRSSGMDMTVIAAIAAAATVDGTDPIIVALLPALLFACVSNEGVLRRFLNGRIAQYLGRISYSVYMVQWVVEFVVLRAMPHAPPPVNDAVFVAGTILVAIPVSHFIEYPARNWLRDFAITRPRASTVPDLPA